MKKTITPTLAIILLAGCTEDNGRPGIEPGQDGLVPITTRTVSATTKAPVNTGDGFTAGIAGWESDATADYTAVPTWYNTAEITASTSPAGITLNPTRTYHADPSVKTYMAAWHPAGEPADGLVTFANTDGQVDAMTAAPVSGSARDYEGKTLAFSHPTTQIKFLVVADASLDAGTRIESITIKQAQLPVGFDLSSGTPAVTYAAAADLPVPAITPAEITATAAQAGAPVMIKPLAGNQMTLDVTTSEAHFANVVATIDDDTDFQPGKAYAITLTFRQADILLKATVTPWDYSGQGSGIIE